MKKSRNGVKFVGLWIFFGLSANTFGFGGLEGISYTDASNLWLADRLGAFAPPTDPFKTSPFPRSPVVPGYGYGGTRSPLPNRAVAPRISASALMNPAASGLANFGRAQSARRTPPPAPRTPARPSQRYGMPSDMGLHLMPGFSASPH